jgi:hypothetical protein
MSSKKKSGELEEETLAEDLVEHKEDYLNITSIVASVAGVAATIVASIELSIPVMLIGAAAGTVAAITKLLASQKRQEEDVIGESSTDLLEESPESNATQSKPSPVNISSEDQQ